MKRRAIYINNEFSSCDPLDGGRALRIPDVFTNIYSDFYSIYGEYRTSVARCKISFFIEDSIIGQENFFMYSFHFPFAGYCSRVIEFVVQFDKPKNGSDSLRVA